MPQQISAMRSCFKLAVFPSWSQCMKTKGGQSRSGEFWIFSVFFPLFFFCSMFELLLLEFLPYWGFFLNRQEKPQDPCVSKQPTIMTPASYCTNQMRTCLPKTRQTILNTWAKHVIFCFGFTEFSLLALDGCPVTQQPISSVHHSIALN